MCSTKKAATLQAGCVRRKKDLNTLRELNLAPRIHGSVKSMTCRTKVQDAGVHGRYFRRWLQVSVGRWDSRRGLHDLYQQRDFRYGSAQIGGPQEAGGAGTVS